MCIDVCTFCTFVSRLGVVLLGGVPGVHWLAKLARYRPTSSSAWVGRRLGCALMGLTKKVAVGSARFSCCAPDPHSTVRFDSLARMECRQRFARRSRNAVMPRNQANPRSNYIDKYRKDKSGTQRKPASDDLALPGYKDGNAFNYFGAPTVNRVRTIACVGLPSARCSNGLGVGPPKQKKTHLLLRSGVLHPKEQQSTRQSNFESVMLNMPTNNGKT